MLLKPELREIDEAEFAAAGIGLRHEIAFQKDVVWGMKAECTRRIGVGRRSQDRVARDIPRPTEDFDRPPLESRARYCPAILVVGSDQVDVLLADVLMGRVSGIRELRLETRIG